MAISFKQLFYVLVEASLIFLSAILGTFAWNHLSPIFNSLDWGGGLMQDIVHYWQAYLTIAIILVGLVVILYYRARQEKDYASKADIEKLTASIDALTREIRADRESRNGK